LSLPILASETEAEKPVYVDLDGDGLDDNRIDFRDGFLIEEEDAESSGSSMGGQSVDFFSSVAAEVEIELPLTNKDRFYERKFSTRGISSNRGEFGGSAGESSSAGKTCIGGICF